MSTNQTASSFSGSMRILTTSGYQTFADLSTKGFEMFIGYGGKIISGSVFANGVKPIQEVSFYNSDKKLHITENVIFMDENENPIELIDASNQKIKRHTLINNEISEYCKYGYIQNNINNSEFYYGGTFININKTELELTKLWENEKQIESHTKKDNQFVFNFPENIIFSNHALPKQIYLAEPKEVLMYLKGLFSAYASINIGNKLIMLKTHHKDIALEVFNLLNIFEINSKLQIGCDGTLNILNIKEFESIEIFAEKIGFIQNKLNDKLIKILDKTPKITKIEYLEDAEVFDFELNDDCHWGIVEDMIIHNSN